MWFGEWEDGCWPHNITAVAHAVDVLAQTDLPNNSGRRLPGRTPCSGTTYCCRRRMELCARKPFKGAARIVSTCG
jgi:hypothetical protein